MMRWLSAVLAVVLAVVFAPGAGADERIVGGREVDIDVVPWTLSLQYGGEHYCGAVLVSASVAVTAAHCTDGVPVREMSVRAGSSVHAANGVERRVASVVQHPRYSPSTTDYDVSVLRLDGAVPLSAEVGVARVARVAPAAGEVVLVAGWGNLTEAGPPAMHLRAVEVPVVSRAGCVGAYGPSVTGRMLCAGFPEGRKDSCQGDSGGPLTAGGVVVGLVSWGHGCARAGAYGVYTNVAVLRGWIERHAGL